LISKEIELKKKLDEVDLLKKSELMKQQVKEISKEPVITTAKL